MKYRPARGTHDMLGLEIEKFDKIIIEISKIGKIFNFLKIETPIFEFTELFSKPLGEHSDVVLKEMYSFNDRNQTSLTLRPEYTIPMIGASGAIAGVLGGYLVLYPKANIKVLFYNVCVV